MGKIIGFTYNLETEKKPFGWLPGDFNAEFDRENLINDIAVALESRGHQIIKIGSAYNLMQKINILAGIDIVFNIAEGYFGRNRESQVPIIVEMMGKPFVGSDGLTMSITLDKLMTKKILLQQGINTPAFFEIAGQESVRRIPLKFPMIVKPRCEGSSKGITKDSVVHNEKELRRQAGVILDTYRQPALIEEFIQGSEFTVVVMGNNPAQALPPVQITIDREFYLGDCFYSFDHIRSGRLDYICPPKISKELEQKLKKIAVATYEAVECRDFGRVDIRVNEKGVPFVLEINPLPSLSKTDTFSPIAACLGITWEDMINRILVHALERYGMVFAPAKKKVCV